MIGTSDYKSYSRKKGAIDKTNIKYTPRVVSASMTQIYLIRAFLKYINNEYAPLRQKKGILSSAEIESNDVKNFDTFYSTSYYFNDVLNCSFHVKNIVNLSSFWYRENFLDITKCVQFPIELSLPWILTEHVLSKKDALADIPQIENLFYILDIYNDAAQSALYEYNQQYLYDEIEAETNLVVDQVVFLLSEDMYQYYKSIATTITIDKSLKHQLEELRQIPFLTTANRRYEHLLIQTHVKLLGRSINFNYLCGQYIQKKLNADIDALIKKFESCSIEMGLVEFKNGLFIIKRLYLLLLEYFNWESFDSLFSDINEQIITSSYRGRITTHILRSLTHDIVSNYAYNYYSQRFVKAPIVVRTIDYLKCPKSSALLTFYGSNTIKIFDMVARLTKGYFGLIHYEALLDIGQYFEISLIIIECLGLLTVKIKQINDYVEALAEDMEHLKLPKFHFNTTGNYQFFENKL